jgi:very-short-patch-repair endonuclease
VKPQLIDVDWVKSFIDNNTNYGALERTIRAKNPELYNIFINSWELEHNPKSFLEILYQYFNPTSVKCPYGNTKKFEYFRTGYRCIKSCKCVKETQTKTMLEKYGVEHALQSDIFLDKCKDTFREKYNTDILSDINKEKKKNTNTERYGAEFPLQSNIIQNKIKQRTLDSIGYEYPFQSEIIQNKSKTTILEKYGVDCIFKLPENREKAIDATIDKFGTHSSFSSVDVKHKIRNSIKEKYGVDHISQRHIDPDLLLKFKDDITFTNVYNSLSSVIEVQEYFGVKTSSVHKRAVALGLPRKRTFVSTYEQEVVDFIKNYVSDIRQSDRSLISPKELDIFLPEYNLAIEFDGIYHHSDKFIDERKLHLNKTEACLNIGIKLIHIFSDEWLFKKDIVKSRILNAISKVEYKIYARKTKIKEVDHTIAKDFLNLNHIQGAANSSINLGLYYNDELVALMTFGKPRYNKHYDYELIRYCSKVYTSVIGGASKLLNYFTKTYKGSIISYADRRWSTGGLYKTLGFQFVKNTDPNYFYVIGQKRESRDKYQKHKLSKILKSFDETISETQNMRNNGYYKIYDCGNSVWILK